MNTEEHETKLNFTMNEK